MKTQINRSKSNRKLRHYMKIYNWVKTLAEKRSKVVIGAKPRIELKNLVYFADNYISPDEIISIWKRKQKSPF